MTILLIVTCRCGTALREANRTVGARFSLAARHLAHKRALHCCNRSNQTRYRTNKTGRHCEKSHRARITARRILIKRIIGIWNRSWNGNPQKCVIIMPRKGRDEPFVAINHHCESGFGCRCYAGRSCDFLCMCDERGSIEQLLLFAEFR